VSRAKKAAIFTLGCKTNQYDTQSMESVLAAEGYDIVDFSEKADVYIINTCTVTAVSDQKSRQMIHRARRLNPGALVIAAGCLPQRASEETLALDGIDAVIGTSSANKLPELIERASKGKKCNAVSNTSSHDPFTASAGAHEGRTRALIKIQEGCDHFCSYCIVPYVRGLPRSRPTIDILREARDMAQKGYREIVLTGIQISDYGKDLKDSTLIQLLEQLNSTEGIARIRLGSIESEMLSDDFVHRAANLPKLCRHYHVPLQSGSDSVLERMNRPYTTKEYAGRIARLRAAILDVAVTTDVLTGFPGETDDEFLQTCRFVEKMAFNQAHVFPYSRRKGTPAYDMPGQLSKAEKKTRATELAAIAHRSQRQHLERLRGSVQEVLVEESTGENVCGHTDRYVLVRVQGKASPNEIINVRIHGIRDDAVHGMIEPNP
jgi:threonylcarbamoyladenosine tRNA methylthiotransferase MtaB